MSTVTKAVIPAAGRGTRFLPVTKSLPKEMLPVVDTPSIQYVVEEAVAAGLTDILIITARGKHAIEDHFDQNVDLELFLEQRDKGAQLSELQALDDLADIHYIRQTEQLGLGHAVGLARKHVGDEPFAVLLGDDIMVDDAALLSSMLAVHEREHASVLALLEVTPAEIASLGCAEVDLLDDTLGRVRSIVEKPKPEEAPSNLAVIGRYVFTPEIFDALDRITQGVGGELQLTDAIGLLLADSAVFGRIFTHGRYDIGKKLGFLQANIELALDRDDVGPELADYLRELVRARGLT
ncbi:MAG: UTP--glucose-1-phosphate uridylyltransferase GalU [Acidimicrobiia bacterium]